MDDTKKEKNARRALARREEGGRWATYEAHRGNTLPAPPHVRNSTRALHAFSKKSYRIRKIKKILHLLLNFKVTG